MKLTRKELYDLVWSEPMTTICKKFGISDNGLRKHCKLMNIPTPHNGYWAKLQYGKEVKKTPLPNDYEGKKQDVNLKEIDPSEAIVKIEKPVNMQTLREQEISEGDMSCFIVPEVLYAKDPIIIDTKEKLRIGRDEDNTYLKNNPYKSKIKETLNIYVDTKSIDRALCIFSTVIKALRARGHNIKINNNETYAIIAEEEIKINITERRKIIPDNKLRATAYCGELHFNITYGYSKLSYGDTACTKLEDKIVTIIAKLELIAEDIKEERIREEQKRIEREEEKRRQREFDEKKKTELKNFQALFTMAERLYKANIIRDYISAYEKHLIERGIEDGTILSELEWAKEKADWLDPFISKPDKYLDYYNKESITRSECPNQNSYYRSDSQELYSDNYWIRPWWKKK